MTLPTDFPYQTLAGSPPLAYRQEGAGTGQAGILFLPGFYSNMTGTKASFLAEKSLTSGRVFTRFDYRGHGFSGGKFEDSTIGDWLEDAGRVLTQVAKGPQILVGSSMGGWIMLLLALKYPQQVAGLVGVASAPDFTEDLLWKQLTPAQRQEMEEKGIIYEKSEYEEGSLPLTFKLVQEARKHLLLNRPINITAPVRLIQGMLDNDVPWGWSLRIADMITGGNVRTTLIKDGDHRLSRPEDLELLWKEIESISA